MAKVNQRVAKLQGEITSLEQHAEKLQREEPQAYQNERAEIEANLQKLRIGHLESLIEVYKEQNPEKYATKKDSLEAKLQYLREGGDVKMWDYSKWKKLQEVKEVEAKEAETKVEPAVTKPEPEPESKPGIKCEHCDFVAKNSNGLRFHAVKHDKP